MAYPPKQQTRLCSHEQIERERKTNSAEEFGWSRSVKFWDAASCLCKSMLLKCQLSTAAVRPSSFWRGQLLHRPPSVPPLKGTLWRLEALFFPGGDNGGSTWPWASVPRLCFTSVEEENDWRKQIWKKSKKKAIRFLFFSVKLFFWRILESYIDFNISRALFTTVQGCQTHHAISPAVAAAASRCIAGCSSRTPPTVRISAQFTGRIEKMATQTHFHSRGLSAQEFNAPPPSVPTDGSLWNHDRVCLIELGNCCFCET